MGLLRKLLGGSRPRHVIKRSVRRAVRAIKRHQADPTLGMSAEKIGAIGEAKVDSALNPFIFGKVEHRQINNLVLQDEYGKTHQIDHVEIRHNGIFCIETKNYKGWVFGDATSKVWTQTLRNQKNSFLNPIKQNEIHCLNVKKALNNKYRVNSVVVMAHNNADRIDSDIVINLSDLKRYLGDYYDGTNLTTEEMDWIHTTLLVKSKNVSNEEHVENIKQTQIDIQNDICPRCGGKLVTRKGAKGFFMGCSNYPKCKFTKPFD